MIVCDWYVLLKLLVCVIYADAVCTSEGPGCRCVCCTGSQSLYHQVYKADHMSKTCKATRSGPLRTVLHPGRVHLPVRLLWSGARGPSIRTQPLLFSGNGVSSSTQDWYSLRHSLTWEGSEAEAVSGSLPMTLSPTWKVMLLSDGSVTKHLQLLTNSTVQVDCLEMRNIDVSIEGLPAIAQLIEGPRLQRQVLLSASSSPQVPLVYAASWWSARECEMYLKDKTLPIWTSLQQQQVELYRQIDTVYLGTNPALEDIFGCKGPFWGREYLFYHNHKPLVCISEVFSNSLQRYCGPISLVH